MWVPPPTHPRSTLSPLARVEASQMPAVIRQEVTWRARPGRVLVVKRRTWANTGHARPTVRRRFADDVLAVAPAGARSPVAADHATRAAPSSTPGRDRRRGPL